MNKDNAIGFSIGLLTGAAIGGVLALLFAPKSGEETRQLIKDKVMETRERAIDAAEHVKDFATETADKVREKTSGVIDVVREAASESNRKGQAVIHAIKN